MAPKKLSRLPTFDHIREGISKQLAGQGTAKADASAHPASDDQSDRVENAGRPPTAREARHKWRTNSRASSGMLEVMLGGLDARNVDAEEHVLSLRGIAVLAISSACGCYGLRLALRDFAQEHKWFQRLGSGKRLAVELYMVGILYGAAWLGFSGRKALRGRWDDPSGVTRALSLSLGYHLHDLVVLRSLVFADPLMLLHHLLQLVIHASTLRSRGTLWLSPAIMGHVASNIPLNLLRILRVAGASPGRTASRVLLVLYAGSFVLTKTLAMPTVCLWNWALQPKPEFQQAHYLPAKVSLCATYWLHHLWFAQALRGAPEVLAISGSDLSLRELRDLAMVPLGRGLATLGFVGVVGTYLVLPVGLPFIVLAFRHGRQKLALMFLGALAALTWSPLPQQAPSWFSHSWPLRFISSRLADYFKFRMVRKEAFRGDRRYLCAAYPHGIFPLGMYLAMRQLADEGLAPNFVGASVLFKLPVLRQLMAYLGGVAATRGNLLKCLQRAQPHNVTFVVPGGIGEMFYTRPDIEHILTDHSGFVRTAMQTGADLVPIYCLGHTQLFDVAGGFLGRMCERFSRWARTSILLWSGRWGTPFIPHPQQIVALVGRPIPVGDATAEPSQAAVDRLHARFCEELAALFDEHKQLCRGYGDKELYLGSRARVPPKPTLELAEYSHSKL